MALDGDLDQVTDNGLDIAADIADLGELGRLDLDKGCIGQAGQATGNFGLADAGRTDHQDVLRCDFLTQGLGHLGTPPAVAQGNGDRFFGVVLADDMLVQFGDDFPVGVIADPPLIRAPRS